MGPEGKAAGPRKNGVGRGGPSADERVHVRRREVESGEPLDRGTHQDIAGEK
jgi:hypothetical protein